MPNIFLKRCIADILLFAAIVIAPWWLSLPAAIMLMFYFDRYYEAIVAALIFDLLYGVPLPALFNIPFLSTFVLGALFYSMESIKPNLRLRR